MRRSQEMGSRSEPANESHLPLANIASPSKLDGAAALGDSKILLIRNANGWHMDALATT